MNDDSKKWVMPEWMEEYLPLMIYPKFQIEDLMNDKSDVFTNTVRALMAVGVKGMVDLLLRMRLSGKLRLNWKYGYDGVTHKEHGDFYVGHLPDKEGDLKYRVIPDWMAKDMDEEGMWWLPLEEVDEERVLCGLVDRDWET